MRFALNFMETDAQRLVELTQEAEAAGWDAVLLPDCISIQTDTIPAMPFYDPWVVLGALAHSTERIRLGTLVTALPRRRPWKLAREAGTVDHLSKGRLILGVGLGVPEHDGGFYKVGEETDLKKRAERLDEGLEILGGLWSGKPFSFSGRHYQVQEMTMLPPPVQKPRIPVWVVGVWPKPKSMRRAIRWDGVVLQKFGAGPEWVATPDEVSEVREWVEMNRTEKGPFDILVGKTRSPRKLAQAGATWSVEMIFDKPKKTLERIRRGPPRG